MITYSSEENRKDYSQPILSNGELSTALDFMGTNRFCVSENDNEEDGKKIGRAFAGDYIWWSGRRYAYSVQRYLIPFGKLDFMASKLPLRPAKWSQTLDTEGAASFSECIYEGGAKAEIDAFLHHDVNLLAIRRRFHGFDKKDVSFIYDLCGKEAPDRFPRYMETSAEIDGLTHGFKIRFSINGQWDYRGVILFFTDRKLRPRQNGNRFILSGKAADTSVYMIFRDNINSEAYEAEAEATAAEVLSKGFDGMYSSHKKAWEDFLYESHVSLSDEKIMQVYRSAQYNLKAWTTRWSVPIGINDCYWEGHFFAYDEYFSFIALLTGGHRSLARRVPDFRKSGLQKAISRMSSKFMTEARYPWQTVETGEEASTPGFWYEHIFHMANASIGAFEYYLYTNDTDFLRETAWPVMRACSEFYLRHMIYVIEGGKTVIGRCTDWERLGSSVINPYFTTCGVIYTLRLSAEAARILNTDEEFIRTAEETANRLYEGLPSDGEKYVPHPGTDHRSIGVFGGMFPYFIQDENNVLQRNAIEDFQKYEGTYGNMYSVGKGVSSWFASWKSIAYSRLHEPCRAFAGIRQAVNTSGCFGELFEINEENLIMRPWFTTAAGTFITAVHNALIQSSHGTVDLLPGFPAEEKDVSFTLPAKGDITVSVTVKDGKLKELSVIPGEKCDTAKLNVRLPLWLNIDDDTVINSGAELQFTNRKI